MALLAKPEPPATPVAHHGFVSEPPPGPGQPFTVTVPDFDAEGGHVFQIRRWAARGATIPAAGDEVLVVVDDVAEPWVATWWPEGGEAAGSVKGSVVHGTNPSLPRPGGFESVEWIGTVEPLNAADNDTWINPA